jgi:hypothetical protein
VSNEGTRVQEKEREMSDTVLSSLKEAFTHADECYIDLDAVIDHLVKTQEALPEKDTELQAATTRMLDEAFAIQDSCHAFLKELDDLRLKYRAAYIPTQISPEVDEFLEVLAKIEARRRGLRSKPE